MAECELAHDLEVAVALAQDAARAAMAHYRPGLAVDFKHGDPSDPVTQADRDANEVLMAGLGRAFPEDALLAEESLASHAYAARQHSRRLWCIDPIDGTREFVAHSGHFAVMVGLAIAGQARLGVVLQPTEQIVYAGYLGDHGDRVAWMQQGQGPRTALAVSGPTPAGDTRMVVSRSWRSRGVQAVAARMGITQQLPWGSVGLKMGVLARAHAELYISASNKTHEWDACGPEAILCAAGGTVTDLAGGPLRYNKPTTQTPRGIVASHGLRHAEALAAIAAVAESLGLAKAWGLAAQHAPT